MRAEGGVYGSLCAERVMGVRGPSFRVLLLGSLLLHALAIVPAWLQQRFVAEPVVSSPFGARSDAAPATDSALVEVPVSLEQPASTPQHRPPEAAELPSDAVPVEPRPPPERDAPTLARKPTPGRPAPATKAPAEPAAAAKLRAAPASEYDQGEDWLSLAEQLPPESEAEPGAAAPADATGAPSDPAPEPDPLVERLLAAERKKAQMRRPLLPQDSVAAAEPPPPPSVPSEVPRAAASMVVDVPVALTRWLSEQAPTNPRWLELGRGTHRASVRLRLRDGRLLDSEIESGAPPALGDVLNGALFYLGKRHLPGGNVHPASGELQVVVEAQLSQDTAAGSERLPAIRHFTTEGGRYLPRARVRLPNGTRIDIRVSADPRRRSSD